MTFDLAIIAVSERAVQCALEDGSPAFWLPRKQVEWRGALEPGAIVSADVPRWLALKHRQLVASRVSTQKVLDLNPVGLDPEKSKEPLPMADTNDFRGALFKNDRKENDRHPDYKGDAIVNGRKVWISAWIKTSEKTGKKFMSLAFKPAEEQRPAEPQRQPERANTYATASGRDDRQRQPDRGGPTFDDDSVPF